MSTSKTKGGATPYVVAVAVTGFVIFLLYVMLFMPKLKEASAVRATIDTVAQEIAIQQAQLDEIDIMTQTMPELEAGMAAFNEDFTLDPEQKGLFAAISASASAAGVELVTLNPLPPELPEPEDVVDENGELLPPEIPVLATVNLKVEARGSTAALNSFLRGLEGLDRPVSVTAFEISPYGEEDELFLLGATVKTWMADPLTAPIINEDGTISMPEGYVADEETEEMQP